MKHVIICREYPPAPGGGIGTYAYHISRLLAVSGETVHVIGQSWEGAEREVEEQYDGRLIIHRVPFLDWASFKGPRPSPAIKSKRARALFDSSFHPQCFSWTASLLAENLIEQEGIDVIEAQDFEAPLYFLQIRRALGLGPKRRPPCIIHLHSQMEFIVHYNDWDMGHSYFLTSKRLEDYSIAAADAHLSPSRFLARQVEGFYGLEENTIPVIPYPIGNSPMISRDKDTWENGTICYVGRIERRKGLIEWIDAAVSVAHEYPAVHFEFIGSDVLDTGGRSVEEFLKERIPNGQRKRFHFRGEHKRSSLSRFLAQARMAVVPSRWENFPNTCIEAMCSGLPVIVSPEGGMSEMIEDGRTGWLAPNARSDGLALALRRALDTPATKLAEMGRKASSDIRQLCDNDIIVQKHLNFRRQVADKGSKSSQHLPMNLPWAKRPLSDESARRTPQKDSSEGIAIVLTCSGSGDFLEESQRSLEKQTRKPLTFVVVDERSTEKHKMKAPENTRQKEYRTIHFESAEGAASAKNAGIDAIVSTGLNPQGFVFLRAGNLLQPNFIEICESIFQRCPEVGIISCWARHAETDNEIWIKPCPSFPYQWLSNEVASFSAIRTEALHEAGRFRIAMRSGYEDWDLFNAVMAAGWVAVTIPDILGCLRPMEDPIQDMMGNHPYGKMPRELLERFPDLIARDATDIIYLTESRAAQPLHWELFKLKEQRAMIRMRLKHPSRTALEVLMKLKQKILRRTSFRLFDSISRKDRYT